MDKIYKTYLFHYNPNHDKLGRFARSNNSGSSDYILPKKTKVYRVSGSSNENENTKDITYVSATKADSKIYTVTSKETFGATHKYTFKVKKDAKIAGRSTQRRIFKELLKEYKIKDFVDHINYVDSQVNSDLENINSIKDTRDVYKNVNRSQKDFTKAYDMFCMNLNNCDSKLSEAFFKKLNEKGYDGAVDEYDSHDPNHPALQLLSNGNVNVKAQRAVIFMNRSENLERISKRRITFAERAMAYAWLQEKGLLEEKIVESETDGGYDLEKKK